MIILLSFLNTQKYLISDLEFFKKRCGVMAFNLFKKKRKSLELPGKSELDIPPVPSMPEKAVELPTFPTLEESRAEAKAESPKMKEKPMPKVEEFERSAVRKVEEEVGDREGLELTKPIFIDAKLYKGVMDDIGVLKNVLKDSADSLVKISDLKDDREKNYSIWHKQIEDIQKKLIYADNTLFSKKGS